MPRIGLIVAALTVVALSGRVAPAQENTCIADWSVAAPIVRKEGLVTVEQLSTLARSRLSGEIVKTALCEQKGGYVFRLLVKGMNGQLKNVTVDAKAPFER
jgi:uncharacterized membrane protein YkoI